MCKKFIYLFSALLLSFACTGYADVVIGDWENGSYDAWIDWGGGTIESIGAPKYTFSETGATLGTSALKVSPGSGWQQNLSIKLADIGMLDAFKTGTAFAIDVTYNSEDWDPNTTYAGIYTLSLNAEGYGWNDVGGTKGVELNGVVFSDTLNPDSPGNIPLTDPGVPGTTVTGTWTWDYSGILDSIPDAPTYVEFIIATNSDAAGAYYFDNARIVGAELPEPAPKIVWVSEWNADANGVPFDQGWIDLLAAQGYEVDANTAGDYTEVSEGELANLEAADLIIVSRNSNSGNYAGDVNEITLWNSVDTPLILMSAYLTRNSKWQWIDSGTTNQGVPTTLMDVIAVDHPIFEGVTTEAVDSMNLAYVIDDMISAETTEIASTDVGNGTLLATRMDNGNIWIAEWEAGVTGYEGTDQVLAGKRLYFAAGGGQGQEAGVMSFNEDGQTMFLNAIEYLLPADSVSTNPADMEDASLWSDMPYDANQVVAPTFTFNYTDDKPSAGSGGCLRVQWVNPGTDSQVVDHLLYRAVDVEPGHTYTVTASFKDITPGNIKNFWFQVGLLDEIPTSTKPPFHEINGFNEWLGCGPGLDGTLQDDGCRYDGFYTVPADTDPNTQFFLAGQIGQWSDEVLTVDVLIDDFDLVDLGTE